MKARVYVTLKAGVLDPQGKAIQHAVETLGFSGIKDVRAGKYFEVEFSEKNQNSANQLLTEICKTLLANTVIEDYRFELLDE